MKKSYRIIVIILSLLLFTSCIRVETVIKVNKDGSGTITETVMMSKVFVDMMRSFSESFSDLGGDEAKEAEEFSLFDEEKLTSEAMDYGEGVAYSSGKKVVDKDWEGYTAVYSFKDISKVKLNTSQEDKVDTGMNGPSMEDEPQEEKDDEFYYFTFEKGSTPKLIINRYEVEKGDDTTEEFEETETTDEGSEMDMMNSEMMNMFTGMHFNMTIEVNGKVTNSNASYRDGSVITLMDMDFGKMMKNKEAFSELTKKKPETASEMKSFMEKFDGLKLELEQPITVSFK
ncbi:MAG: hypothetical protein ACFHWX_04215 [Bacteroidota bacterium]